MNELAGLNAILTGASGGIGTYIARALAMQGVNLVLAARSVDKLETLAGEMRALGVTAEAVACDVCDEDSRQALIARAIEVLGHVDILINNAGVEEVVHFELQDPEMIRATIDTNLLAPMLLTRSLLPHMIERNSGHVINISSLSGRTGMPYGSAYAGSKAGISEWGLSLAVEMKERGVAVTNVIPGFVSDAGMHARKGRPAPNAIGEVTPEKVAAAVVKALNKKALEIFVTKRPVKPLIALKALSTNAALKVGETMGVVSYLRTLADDRARKNQKP